MSVSTASGRSAARLARSSVSPRAPIASGSAGRARRCWCRRALRWRGRAPRGNRSPTSRSPLRNADTRPSKHSSFGEAPAAALPYLDPMLNRISHTFIHVLDQDEALDFYVGKLGMVVSTDADIGTMRWLTVKFPDQPDVELVLMKPGPPAYDDETTEQIRELVSKGGGAGL